MRSPDNQTPNTDTLDSPQNTTSRIDPGSETPPLAKDTTSHINPASKSEPMTQVQADSVLTREQLPDSRLRITLTVGTVAILLFVAALYYGIINP